MTKISNAELGALHDAMAHPAADERVMEATRARARRFGWNEEQIERAYGKPRSQEEIECALDEVRARARRYGWPEEMIERHYGKPSAQRSK